jgi:hypothetical protein
MREMANAYEGPHRVILNRNEGNLGIGRHINRSMGIARGELIVGAAGDDISVASRTQSLVDHWLGANRRPSSICSSAEMIDENGEHISRQDGRPFRGDLLTAITHHFSGLQGATHAWARRIFDVFGDLLPDTVCEDRVIPLRSFFLGGTSYVEECLVKYRVHGENISHHYKVHEDDLIARTVEIHKRNLNIFENYLKDLSVAKDHGLLSGEEYRRIDSQIRSSKLIITNKIAFLSGSFVQKVGLIVECLLTNPSQSARWTIMLVLPRIYIRNQKKNLGVK